MPDGGQVTVSEAAAQAPVLVKNDDQEIEENSILAIDISATDGNFDHITLSVENLPSFATFSETGEGRGSILFEPVIGDAGEYSDIIIIASDGELTDKDTIVITVTELTSIFTQDVSEPMIIYPNPVKNGILNIGNIQYVESESIALEIINLLGETVREYNYPMQDEYTISDLENLTNGIYILRIRSEQKVRTGQFIIE